MTSPRQARQSTPRGPRMYAWPPQPPHEFEVMSVTSALKSLPKPFLVGWAAKVAAEFACANLPALTALVASGETAAAEAAVKNARFRDMQKKADRGTIVHAAMEAYLAGGLDKEVVAEQLREARVPANMHKSTAGMIQGLLQYLQDTEPGVYWSEATVYSREHGYAGTADLIASLPIGGRRMAAVLDVKTSKRIYDEVALQLVGYARADFVGLDDGTEKPILPRNAAGGPRIQWGVVVRPTASGTYETATFALTDELFDRYLAVLEVAKTEGLEASVRRPS